MSLEGKALIPLVHSHHGGLSGVYDWEWQRQQVWRWAVAGGWRGVNETLTCVIAAWAGVVGGSRIGMVPSNNGGKIYAVMSGSSCLHAAELPKMTHDSDGIAVHF